MKGIRTPQRPEPARRAEDGACAALEVGATAGPRRTYGPPSFERHGRLAEVTRFGGSEVLDSGGGLGQAP